MATAEILSQGDEVVTGQTVDTNAAWLAERLIDLGYDVTRHTAVPDRLGALRDEIAAAAARSDVTVCTGGLGPTTDDLTAQAVADAFDRPLAFDPVAMAHIEALYARYGRPMPEINRKQAWLPTGSVRLDNDWGTAPGFAVEQGTAWLAFLPGVPREMKEMFTHRVVPALVHRHALVPARLVTLRTTGVGESDLQERLGAVDAPGVVVGYRTMLPENQVKLRFEPGTPEESVRALVADVAGRIGSPVFAIEGLSGAPLGPGSLAEVIGRDLVRRRETLAVAESCTGGRVAAMCTAVAGSSAWFLEGVVTYANASKIRLLGVDPATLDAYGAVSADVARQMAIGVRERAGTTYGISVTGIAGPSGGTEHKPVGTVHVALAAPDAVHHRKLKLGGDRTRIQDLSAASALDLLRRKLQDHL